MCFTIEGGLLFIGGKERAIPTYNRCGIAYFLKTNTYPLDDLVYFMRDLFHCHVEGEQTTQALY